MRGPNLTRGSALKNGGRSRRQHTIHLDRTEGESQRPILDSSTRLRREGSTLSANAEAVGVPLDLSQSATEVDSPEPDVPPEPDVLPEGLSNSSSISRSVSSVDVLSEFDFDSGSESPLSTSVKSVS